MKLDIQFSKNFEVERIENTLAKMDWYRTKGYRPRLPEGIDEDSSKTEIEKIVDKEFDQDKYSGVSEGLLVSFNLIKDELENKLVQISGNDVPKEFDVFITQYGVGGSYNPPRTVIYNCRMGDAAKTIIHEITHLVIQPYIDQYKIEQWDKERIVDLILNSEQFSFLNYDSWQRDYHGAEERVDELFNKFFFKDHEDFFNKLTESNN